MSLKLLVPLDFQVFRALKVDLAIVEVVACGSHQWCPMVIPWLSQGNVRLILESTLDAIADGATRPFFSMRQRLSPRTYPDLKRNPLALSSR